jgi:ABC-type uncharacterized transport system ATPase subunit
MIVACRWRIGSTCRFAGRVAVEPLNLSVERGSIYGLLGHNGADMGVMVLNWFEF